MIPDKGGIDNKKIQEFCRQVPKLVSYNTSFVTIYKKLFSTEFNIIVFAGITCPSKWIPKHWDVKKTSQITAYRWTDRIIRITNNKIW